MVTRMLRRHRSLVLTVVALIAASVVVAVVAIASNGYTAQKLTLDNASVWVANGSQQAVGRANTQVLQLDSVVRSTAADLTTVQSGSSVFMVDHANASLAVIDPATSTTTDTVALPPNNTQVLLAADRVVIFEQGTGELWIVPLVDLGGFTATSPASLHLGQDSAVAVTPSGVLYAYSAQTSEVWRVDVTRSDTVGQKWSLSLPNGSRSYQMSAVGDSWALLDAGTRTMYLDGRTIDLSTLIPTTAAPLIQQPGPAADRVLVGTNTALVSVPTSGAAPVPLSSGHSGTGSAPLVLNGCEFGAWSDGTGWRRCAGDPGAGVAQSYPSMPGSARLGYVVNGRNAVLNDRAGGGAWAVQATGQLINNWTGLVQAAQNPQQPKNDQSTPPTVDPVQKPPVAVDDAFGARPGRASILPVLLNDYDPNGDVIVITAVDSIDPTLGRVDIVSRTQQLQITLTPAASGVIRFGYTISDGRGNTAKATVTVTVRTPQENSPPVQVRTTRATVQAGGRVQISTIGDWVDPDGDPIYLSNATTATPDSVSHQPGGDLTFTDAGNGVTSKTATLTVSDGKAQGSGTLVVTVKPPGQVPITIDPWVQLATAGQEVTVTPLLHVHGGSGTLRLNAVPAKQGSTVTPSFEAGTFTFSSTEVRTHYIDFTITDGAQTATGSMRIDVAPASATSTRPITVPQTVFVRSQGTQIVDPTATDIDPAGGVLVVTATADIPKNSGVQAEILAQRYLRVTLTGPLSAPVTFHYTISNGLADAQGTVTVIEIPPPALVQPPVAVDDKITVRVGSVTDIPVLANDSQPDGGAVTLQRTLATPLPDGAGLLFPAGNVLRYLAPKTAGDYSAVYSIAGPDGQTAQARVSISVREVDAATNSAPTPATVTSRVIAGSTVRIDIPLTGIDPDGDTVQLIGISSNPSRGTVLQVGDSYIEYRAGDYSSGTDQFSYTVVDAVGARATGVIRVGISARADGAGNPVANPDEVRVRPGRTVSVQVLANDSDPSGGVLHVANVTPNTAGTTASIVNNTVVSITPPATPGQYAVIYTAANDRGGSSSTFITVTVDPNAPLNAPVANDVTLAVSDVLDRTTVDVPVRKSVFFADGDVSQLGVALVPGYGSGATLLPDGSIRVTIQNQSQVIPYVVTHPDDPNVKAYAFIKVPGYADALPQLNRSAPQLTVASGAALRIDLNQYVVALGGKKVQLADTTTVRATHANGGNLVADGQTLQFTSADQYFGPASITFEVTDGSSPTDPAGHTAILTLPITVTATQNQPPSFAGGQVQFEPGETKELDLTRLTDYPYGNDIAQLVYSILPPLPNGFTATLNGQRLSITASASAASGTTASVLVGVKDASNQGKSGRITLQVVPSTRPLAQPAADRAVAARGQTTSIDVLANDAATNPFPDTPLRVVAIRGLGAALPAGITVTPSADNSRLTVQVAAGVAPTDVNLQYQVADATGSPDRYVWGNVTISVQDVPDPVSDLRVQQFGDRSLKLAWTPGTANNSPITGYQVTMTSAADGSVLGTTTCTATVGCDIRTPGNGPANAVRLAVAAINSIGASTPTALGAPIWSDVIPPPPTNLGSTPLDSGLRVTWTKPDTGTGSAITSYLVTVGGVTQTVTADPAAPVGTAYSARVTGSSIANGSSVGYSVSARNSAPNSLATWNQASGTGTPAGPPIATGSPTASGSLTDGTTAQVAWGGVFAGNGAAVSTYYAALSTGAAPTCTVAGVDQGIPVVTPPSGNVQALDGGATSASFSGLTPNQTYTITVFAYNGQGCTASTQVPVTPRAAPGTVTGIPNSASAPVASSPGRWDFRLDGFTIAAGSTDADTFRYRLIGGTTDQSESAISSPGTFLTTANGSQYGNSIGVQVKACKTYPEGTLCSANWSQTFPLGVPVDNSVPGGLAKVVTANDGLLTATGYWTWGSLPAGPGYTSVTFSCGPDDDPATPNQCEVKGGVLGLAFPDLVVTITANGATYSRNYAWSQY